jgi:hypothetical protein
MLWIGVAIVWLMLPVAFLAGVRRRNRSVHPEWFE